MQVIVTRIPLQAVVEVLHGVSLPNSVVVPVAAGGDTAAVAGRESERVVALLAEQIVEAARTAVEEVVAGAAVDLVIATEREDLVIAARGKYLVVPWSAGDHVVAVGADDDEVGVVEIDPP